MNEYRGKHAPSHPWPVSSSAVVRSSRGGRHRKKSRRRRFWLILLLVVILFLLAYPFLEPRLILTIDRQEVTASDLRLPENKTRLRVVFVSDIHWGHWYSDFDLSRLVSKINDLNPDLLLFGGDYGSDNASAIQFFNHLRNYSLHVNIRSFGVLGESDYAGEDADIVRLQDAMASAKITPLVNDTVQVLIGGGNYIRIAGADDYTVGSPDLKKLTSSVFPREYVIFISHNPSIIPSAQQQQDASGSYEWFDLGLFGHTHGGQMRIFSSMLDLMEDVPERYREGWLSENRSTLLVSRGVGTSVFPCRFLCFPQIHCIDLIPD